MRRIPWLLLTTLFLTSLATGQEITSLPSAVRAVSQGGTGVSTLTGLALGTGTAAFTAYAGTTCTNQFARSLNASGAASCATVGTADIDSTIATLTGGQTFTNKTFLGLTVGDTTTLFNTGGGSDWLVTPAVDGSLAWYNDPNGTQLALTELGVLTIRTGLVITTLAATGAGDVAACWNATTKALSQGATCGASTARVKRDLVPLREGLGLVLQLQPVSFRFRPDVYHGAASLGLVAEDVAALEERLIERDTAGQPYAVRYDLLSAVLVKAVQEQQGQLDALRARLDALEQRAQR